MWFLELAPWNIRHVSLFYINNPILPPTFLFVTLHKSILEFHILHFMFSHKNRGTLPPIIIPTLLLLFPRSFHTHYPIHTKSLFSYPHRGILFVRSIVTSINNSIGVKPFLRSHTHKIRGGREKVLMLLCRAVAVCLSKKFIWLAWNRRVCGMRPKQCDKQSEWM
jgi:hypothetical protein